MPFLYVWREGYRAIWHVEWIDGALGDETRMSSLSKSSAAALKGLEALKSGDLETAHRAFRAAVRNDPRVAMHRFRLAVVEEACGAREQAAEQLTWALKLNPGMADAARRLAAILAGGKIDMARLQPEGLQAALGHPVVDRDLVTAAGLAFLAAQTPLRTPLEAGRKHGWLTAARGLCVERTAPILQHPLLHAVLGAGVVAMPDVEALLTALRRVVLLELTVARLADPRLVAFLVALVQQMWCNEFAWLESPQEVLALEALRPDLQALLAGSPLAVPAALCALMYRAPGPELRAAAAAGGLDDVRPEGLRHALADRLGSDREVEARAAAMPVLTGPASATSTLVAGQYRAAPYPRWTGIPTLAPGQYLRQLEAHFDAQFDRGRLAFAKAPFDVLIAGCGTGRQAVSAGIDYGPQASVLGIDITRTSLGYAQMMAERMHVANVRFAVGDIDAIDRTEPSLEGRFQVVECSGVLHHMADPFAAWGKLLRCLSKDGIMFIGLYSATARRGLAALRAETAFPGAGVDDAGLRAYREHLKQRPGTLAGSEMVGRSGRDFYSASGFRDYFLHVNEHTTSLSDIAGFLAANGLVFRGFVGPSLDVLKAHFPGEAAPGSLERWAQVEARVPGLFAGMYQFWCTRA